jgi:hypothetical protein
VLLGLVSVEPVEKDDQRLDCTDVIENIVGGQVDFLGFFRQVVKK